LRQITQLVDEKVNALKDNITHQVDNRIQEFIVKENQQLKTLAKEQEKYIENQVRQVYENELQTIQSKLEHERKDLTLMMKKSFNEFEEKLHKERIELLTDRQRMKFELEAEYTRIALEWKKTKRRKKIDGASSCFPKQ